MNLRSFLIGCLLIAVFSGFAYLCIGLVRSAVSWRSYIVQSGSMEPSIMTGDLILLQKQDRYTQNQVVTFKNENGRTVTHRIMSVSAKPPFVFSTKGDANQDEDIEEVREEQIIGAVVQVVPKFGYVVKFVKSPWGFIACILIPGVIILYDELRVIFGGFEARRPPRPSSLEK